MRRMPTRAARRNYPTYWLAIYVNVSLAADELPPDYVAKVTAEALIAKPASSNVERVWVWNQAFTLSFPPNRNGIGHDNYSSGEYRT